MSTRFLVIKLVFAGILFYSPSLFAQSTDLYGCAMTNEVASAIANNSAVGLSSINQSLIETTGDKSMDRAFGRALVRLSREFEQNPGFSFYDDGEMKNARATKRTFVRGTWGTIFFGQQMFKSIMQSANDNGIAVLAIVAHEFAHIVQYRLKTTDRLKEGQTTVRRIELHADFMAGWYLGKLKRRNPEVNLLGAGNAIYETGDYKFNDIEHHGTPAERIAAAEEGYEHGIVGVSVSEAFRIGIEYILDTF